MFRAVVGFAFTPSLKKVLLIRKNRPDWQAGFLNGVGGKIEPDETARAAMIRKFEEETGIVHPSWNEFAKLTGHGVEIHCFRTIAKISTAVQTTDEELVHFKTSQLMKQDTKCINNLRWLITMAMYDNPMIPVEFVLTGTANDWKFSNSRK